MPAITLPALPWAREATPQILTYGSKQRGILGGPTTPIERLGSRMAIDVTLPPMKAEPTGRIWVSRLVQAQASEGVLFKWPQLDLDLNTAQHRDGAVRQAMNAGESNLFLKGLFAGQLLREGQWVSIVKAATGRRYLHMVNADQVAQANGDVSAFPITPRLRTSFAVNDVVHIVTPFIEGLLVGDTRDWNLDAARTTGLAFSIEERE